MHLAKPVYESLPLIYVAIGAVAIALVYLDPKGPYALVSLAIGLLGGVAALTIFLHRQDRRAYSREYPRATIELPPPL